VVEVGLALLETLVLAGAAREEAEEEAEAEAAAACGGGGGGGGAPRSLWPAAAVRVAAGVCTSTSIEQAWVARLLHRLKQARRDGPLLYLLYYGYTYYGHSYWLYLQWSRRGATGRCCATCRVTRRQRLYLPCHHLQCL
tara:strand:+ start:54 stop:470 length:417 start_codon:yes stop_codon:yes gene_type:complete